MVVIIMPAITSLIKQLQGDYPDISFIKSDTFSWSPSSNTVSFDDSQPHAAAYCLHELSHAILQHHNYARDIDLIKLERDAWDFAKSTLAARYSASLLDDVIQDNLDTYREWLHARSTCPQCSAIGVQAAQHEYHCLACKQQWRVNEARLCALRRYKN